MMGSPIRILSRHLASAASLHLSAARWRRLLLLQACGLVLLVLAGVLDAGWLLWLAGGLLCGSSVLLWQSKAVPVASNDEALQRQHELQQIEQLELKRYRQLVQFANDIFTWHAADGSVQYISPNVRRLLGYEAQELLGQNLFRLIHPDDLASVHLARADLLAEGTPLPVTFRIANREGVWVWMEMFARLFEIGEGPTRIVGVSRDVTLRRDAEAVMRESERFKALFELARDGMFLIDPQGRVVEVNREAARELGYHRMHLIGMPLVDLLAPGHEDSELQRWSDYFQLVQSGQSELLELSMLCSDDQEKWLEALFSPITQEGRPLVLLAVRDISARRQGAMQLQESLTALRVLHNRLYGIIEGSSDLIAAVDNSFHLIVFNRAFKQSFEQHFRTPVELGVNLLSFVAHDAEQMAQSFLSWQRALAGEVFINIEPLLLAGNTREYEVKYSPIRDEVGDVVGAAYIARDVSTHLQAERELKHALDRLDQARQDTESINEQLKLANRELQRQANQDGMTGIANRRYFDEYLAHEWRRAVRQHEPMALIFADVDFFKKYNDHYGHQLGDTCLREVAQALHSQLRRPADLLARYGGEEFVVLLPGTTLAGAMFIADAMRAAVESLQLPHAASEVSPHVTLSLGVASIVPSEAMAEGFLIYGADQALYIAKKSGRNRTHGNPL